MHSPIHAALASAREAEIVHRSTALRPVRAPRTYRPRAVLVAFAALAIGLAMLAVVAPRADADALVLDRITCKHPSLGSSSDDVYTVTFHGSTTGSFTSTVGVRGPGTAWTGFTAGKEALEDVPVGRWSDDGIDVTALIERDGATDAAGPVLDQWRTFLAATWKTRMLDAGSDGLDPYERVAAGDAMKTAMWLEASQMFGVAVDDDLIDVEVILAFPGVQTTYWFLGPGWIQDNGAYYKLDFEVVQ